MAPSVGLSAGRVGGRTGSPRQRSPLTSSFRRFSTRRSARQQGNSEADQNAASTSGAGGALGRARRPGVVSLLPAVQQRWRSLPSRHQLVAGTAVAFALSNMDKVIMSVAIIPMALDHGWSPSVAGAVQSAFFCGYLLGQLPGGVLCSRLGGRSVLPSGVAVWSAATAMVPPLAATSLSGLCLARAAVGLGEAVAPSAATDLVARAVPAAERSRAVTFIFGGHQVGSIVGLLAAPPLIETAGWQCVFYSFGALGAVWWLWWQVSLLPHAMKEEGISSAGAAETVTGAWAADATPPSSAAGKAARRQQAPLAPGPATLPFRAFLRNRSVQVLMATHFCHNWLHYCMLAWLPSYFTSTMGADLSHAAHTALLPPLAGIAASAVAGSTADALLQRGVPVTAVRKGAQGVSFLGSAAGLLAAAHCSHGGDATAAVACISAAQAMSSVSLAGLHCSHQDLSPKYAGTLLGITNTAGALPGVVGVAAVGALLEVTNGSWEEAFFYPSAALLLLGAAVFTLYVNNEPVNFDAKGADAPFAWEGGMQRLAVSALTMPRKLRRALR